MTCYYNRTARRLIHKMYLQVINIDKSLVDDYLGKGSAISPFIITEPVRRKFHKPLIHKIPVPTCGDSKVNVQSLRILFSLSGKETNTSSSADPELSGGLEILIWTPSEAI